MTYWEHFEEFHKLHKEAMECLDRSVEVNDKDERTRLLDEFERLRKEAWKHFYIFKRVNHRLNRV
jgi:hypothetical protein